MTTKQIDDKLKRLLGPWLKAHQVATAAISGHIRVELFMAHVFRWIVNSDREAWGASELEEIHQRALSLAQDRLNY